MRSLLPIALAVTVAAGCIEVDSKADGVGRGCTSSAECFKDELCVDGACVAMAAVDSRGCDNADDEASYSNFNKVNLGMNTCGTRCNPTGAAGGADPDCMLQCVADEVGLSPDCAGCFADYMVCLTEHCWSICLTDGPSAPGCTGCGADFCGDDFAACSDVPEILSYGPAGQQGDGGEGEGEAPTEGEGEGEGEGEIEGRACTGGESWCDAAGNLVLCVDDGQARAPDGQPGQWGDPIRCDAVYPGMDATCEMLGAMEAECDSARRDIYRWIRICSTMGRSDLADGQEVTAKPGPDIDGVAVFDADDNLKGFASNAGPSMVQESDFDDVTECLGEPDATATGDPSGCGGFTSIGLKGHYVTIGTDFDIVPTDKVVVYEVPNCALSDAPEDFRREPSRLDLSVSSGEGFWFELAEEHAGGQVSHDVPADPGLALGASEVCPACEAGDADCQP